MKAPSISTLLLLSGAHAATCNKRSPHEASPAQRHRDDSSRLETVNLLRARLPQRHSRIKIMIVEFYCMRALWPPGERDPLGTRGKTTPAEVVSGRANAPR